MIATAARQLSRFPYCRLYRRFLNKIVENPQICKRGQGLLFRYAVLFSLANFRPSLRTINGTCHAIQAGEWVASCGELCEKLHLRTHRPLHSTLERLEHLHLIQRQETGSRRVIRFKICCWQKTNTILPYSAPCPKDTGFFFFPVAQAAALINTGRCSEADMLLDLWLHTVFQDSKVPGSDVCPLVCYRGGHERPLVSYAILAQRWGVSKTTVHRVLKKFEQLSLVTIHHCPGKRGSVIVMRGYLSTMFSLADTCPTRQALDTALELSTQENGCPDKKAADETVATAKPFPWPVNTVSKPEIRLILENLRNALYTSGFRCSACPHVFYRLSNLSVCQEGVHPYDLAIVCGDGGPAYRFSLKLESAIRYDGVTVEVI